MSGAQIVGVQGGVGGIAARTEDLRSCAAVLFQVGWAVQGDAQEVAALARFLAGEVVGGLALESAALHRITELGEASRGLASLLGRAADSYDDADSWSLERMAGVVVGQVKNTVKAQTSALTGGLVEAPWDYDMRPLEAAAKAYDLSPFSAVLHGFAALADGRGTARVTATGLERGMAARRPPDSLADLLADLEHRNDQEPGAVDVQVLHYGDGRARRVIVHIPGTSTLLPTLSNPTDVIGDLAALEGTATAYGEGVLECLELAGVTALDEVLLVGHSQGGMVAASLAAQAARTGRYSIRDVVTVGSPIAKIDVPVGVRVLSLENRDDPIPQLDGGRNQDTRDVVTVTVDTGATGLDAHGIESGYLPAADELGASDDPSVRQALASLDPYFGADQVTTSTYRISRG